MSQAIKWGPATPEKSEHTLPFTIMTLARHVALPWCTTILAEYPFLLVHIPRLYGPRRCQWRRNYQDDALDLKDLKAIAYNQCFRSWLTVMRKSGVNFVAGNGAFTWVSHHNVVLFPSTPVPGQLIVVCPTPSLHFASSI